MQSRPIQWKFISCPKIQSLKIRIHFRVEKVLTEFNVLFIPGKKFKILPNPKSPVVIPVSPVRPLVPKKGIA